MNNLISKVEGIIKKREMMNVSFTLSTPLHSPVIIIYADDKVEQFHGLIVESLKSAWRTYDQKVVFLKLTGNSIKLLEGLSGNKNDFNLIFSRDYGLTDFDYSKCSVFTVVSSFNVLEERELSNKIKTIDAAVANLMNGRQNSSYLIAFLNSKNAISEQFRRDCENLNMDCVTDKIVFFIENRSSDGADLTDEVSEMRMFKNLSYIIRMSQLQNVNIKKGCHLISSQEVHKPYYEMAAGIITGVIERVNRYLVEKNNYLRQSNISSEVIANDLGFVNGEFEYIDELSGIIDQLIPTESVLLSLPVAVPEEPQLDTSAAVFNRQTLGTFYAYIESLKIDHIVSLDGFKSNLKKKLSCFDILRDFGSEISIANAVGFMQDRILTNSGEHLPPVGYAKNNIKNRCRNELINSILKPAVIDLYNDANNYMKSLSSTCSQVFSHGSEEIFNFYKNYVYNKLTDNELSSIDKICDPDNWIVSFIEKIVNNDGIYTGSLEQELVHRMAIEDASTVSKTVVQTLTVLEDYYMSNYNYNENVDVGGRIIFMDAESELWNSIRGSLGSVTIFDMPENNEINIVKVYTYKG